MTEWMLLFKIQRIKLAYPGSRPGPAPCHGLPNGLYHQAFLFTLMLQPGWGVGVGKKLLTPSHGFSMSEAR